MEQISLSESFILACVMVFGIALLIKFLMTTPFKRMILKSGFHLGLFNLVWIEDRESRYTLRRVTKTPFGKYIVDSDKDRHYGVLQRDGSISESTRLKRWKPYQEKSLLNGNWMRDWEGLEKH